MATTYDKASLVMIPSGYKDDKLYSIKPTNGDGDFTFSRDGSGASPATRVNASGLIEKGRENLLLQSNSFTTGWGLSNVTMTGGQAGYDGSNDAWLMTDTNSAAYGTIDNLVTTGGITTFSCYAKSGTTDIVGLRPIGGSSPYVFFDLSNGTFEAQGDIANLIDWDIQEVVGGWYRCSVTTSATATQVVIYIATTGGALAPAGSTLYIQDAQLEQGLVATDYIETTTAPVSAGLLGDMPRLDYSGGATCPSLLLEPSRVNLLPISEYFGLWSGNVYDAITPNAATSPEGVDNAYLIETSLNNTGVYIIPVNPISSGDKITTSIFLKAKSGSNSDIISIGMGASAFGGDRASRFDLSDGTIDYANPDHDDVDIQPYGNGWYRCIISDTATANGTFAVTMYSYGTNCDWYAYGAMAELGSYPTSYIPTYGSASTRGQDFCRKTGIGSLLNDSEGTLFLEMQGISDGGDSRRFTISDGSIDNRVSLEYDENAGRIKAFMSTGGTTTGALDESGHPQTENHKIALTYTASAFKIFIDGVLEGEDTSLIGTPVGLDLIEFQSGSTFNPMEGKVKQALVFKTALTDAEAIALTTI